MIIDKYHHSTKLCMLRGSVHELKIVCRFFSNVIKIHDEITYDFYMGLPHVWVLYGEHISIGWMLLSNQILNLINTK